MFELAKKVNEKRRRPRCERLNENAELFLYCSFCIFAAHLQPPMANRRSKVVHRTLIFKYLLDFVSTPFAYFRILRWRKEVRPQSNSNWNALRLDRNGEREALVSALKLIK